MKKTKKAMVQKKNKKMKFKEEEEEEEEEGNIAWILNALNKFQACFNSVVPAPTPLPENVLKKPDLLQLNDYVYDLCKPSGRPSVEIVFFHGFQLGECKQTYFTTWLTPNRSELWLNWITGLFPGARILLVSYDGFATKRDDQGCTDMYVTCENLLQSLTDDATQVGQDGCPVVLVGHSLGGLVMKEVLLQANKVLSLDKVGNSNERVRSFLENVKQLFYYSCPNNGIRLADSKAILPKGSLFKLLTTLNKNAVRCNEEFRKLRDKSNWGASSIVEQVPVDLGSLGRHVVVEEASARHDTDDYYTVQADHFHVCQPISTSDSSFSRLADVIRGTLNKDVHGHRISLPPDLVGHEDQVKQVQRELEKTQHLGIFGIGGIGKTTLAKAVYNAISDRFDYTSFVSDVKLSMGEKVGTAHLQAEILKTLRYKGRECTGNWDRLKGKKVLIILDDVEYESQVFVMTESDEFSAESRVLVTSRYKDILTFKNFGVHYAEFLGYEASKKLFRRHAFREQDAPEAFEHHVAKFTKKCGGLPLALEVAGKYLYTKNQEDVWNAAYKRLSEAKPFGAGKVDRFWSIFQVIYESLQEDEQQMFLDIAACYYGEELDTVKRVWGCCDWGTTAAAGWENLSNYGFVTLDETFGRYIRMHEVLRDFGYSKANPNNVQSHSRICYGGNTLPSWPFKQGTPQVQILKIVMDNSDAWNDLKVVIDIDRLHELSNLRILWLEGVSLRGACNFLPDDLAFLRLRRCTWIDESAPRRSSDRPDSWYCSTLRESSSRKLVQHPSLRYAEINDCRQLEGLLNALGQLTALKHLDFNECRLPRILPNNIFQQLRVLEYLRIQEDEKVVEEAEGAIQLKGLPETLGQLPILKWLDIGIWAMESIPDVLEQLSALEILTLRNCQELVALPSTLGNLRALRRIEIMDCPSLRQLPATLGQLQNLQHLRLSTCLGLVALPNEIYLLRCLKEFEILRCNDLTALPDELGRVGSLQSVRIFCCRKLTSLPNTIGHLRNLRYLEIYGCDGLITLPGTLGKLQELEDLLLRNCQFQYLPSTLGELQSLRRLEIDLREPQLLSDCNALPELPDTLGKLQKLQRLRISRCRNLVALPDNLEDLQTLEQLSLTDCDSLKALPDSLTKLRALRKLKIASCCSLEALPDPLWKLPVLEQLEIKRCWGLRIPPDTIMELQALRHFKIERCQHLQDILPRF